MPILLPFVPSIPHYQFRTTVLGAEYLFVVQYNTRLDLYFLSISDKQPIISGAAIVLGVLIGRTSGHKLFQGGCLLARDTTKSGIDPGFDALGDRVQVMYFSRDDMAAEVLASLSPGT